MLLDFKGDPSTGGHSWNLREQKPWSSLVHPGGQYAFPPEKENEQVAGRVLDGHVPAKVQAVSEGHPGGNFSKFLLRV